MPCESKMTSKIIKFILLYCYFKIILHSIYRFLFIKESWNDYSVFSLIFFINGWTTSQTVAAFVCANTNLYRLFLWPVSALHPCFLSVQFATNCGNQSFFNDFTKSFQVRVIKILTFCYPWLINITFVNQLSLLLIFETAIGETWNEATLASIFAPSQR